MPIIMFPAFWALAPVAPSIIAPANTVAITFFILFLPVACLLKNGSGHVEPLNARILIDWLVAMAILILKNVNMPHFSC